MACLRRVLEVLRGLLVVLPLELALLAAQLVAGAAVAGGALLWVGARSASGALRRRWGVTRG